MKIFVFSDSHNTVSPMLKIIKEQDPQMVIHLGDLVRDALYIKKEFPTLPLEIIAGNNDFEKNYPITKVIEIDDFKILATHGHTFNVKLSLQRLIHYAKSLGINIILFGHTHIPLNSIEQGIYILNPGSASKTYAEIQLGKGKMDAFIKKV